MQDVGTVQWLVEVFVDDLQQVVSFLLGDRYLGRVAAVFAVGGADQGEAVQVWNAEDDALVLVLQDVGVFAFVEARHDDVAALDQADAVRGIELEVILDEAGDPRAGGVDQGACANALQAAIGMLQFNLPQAIHTLSTQATGVGVDVCAVFAGAHGIEHHQTGIVHGAVGIFESAGDCRLERVARAKAQAARGTQALALTRTSRNS